MGVWMDDGGRLWEVEKGSAEHKALVARGAVVSDGLDGEKPSKTGRKTHAKAAAEETPAADGESLGE